VIYNSTERYTFLFRF